jgi:hypothetical protein
MRRPPLVVALALASAFIVFLAAEDQLFVTPAQNGYRVDVCRTWGQGCGQEAANAFCRVQGFESAKAFEVDPKIGAKTPTMTLGDRRVCDQAQCDGFKSITCTRPGEAPAARTRSTAPPPEPGPPPSAKAAAAILGAMKAGSGKPSGAQASSTVPDPKPPSGTQPPPQKSEPGGEPLPSQPDSPSMPSAPGSSLPTAAADPEEFVVIYPKSIQGTLARFGATAAAGQLEEERPVPLKVKTDIFQAEAGDFDGDGQADLALLERPSPQKLGRVDVSFLKYSDAAGFKPTGKVFPLNWDSGIPVMTVGRFLGPGRYGALVYTSGGVASVLSPDLGDVSVKWNPKGIVFPIDADGDGVDDLLDYAEPAGTLDLVSLELTEGPGAGQHLAPIVRQLPTLGPGRRFAVGDFTGDGRADLLIHDSITGAVSIAQFTAKGAIAKTTPVDTGWSATTVWTVGRDYDGDKRDDLLVYDPPAGEVHLIRFTSGAALRDKQLVSKMKPETLIYPGFFAGSGRASYVAMARDLKNKVIHVQFGADGKKQNDGTIIEQMKDGGIIIAGNFVKGR